MADIPNEVTSALDKLGDSEKDAVLSYITNLQSAIKEKDQQIRDLKDKYGADDDTPMATDESQQEQEEQDDNGTPFPSMYESGEDFDKAGELKQEAADLKSSGDWEGALEKYTQAVLAAPPSALLYANRAMALLKLGRPKAAERDCDAALKENPDSAKALRARGKARKELGKYELALKDLSASQAIDFDEETVEDLKFLSEKHKEMEKAEAERRIMEKERLRKRAEDIKNAQEQARSSSKPSSSSARSSGGMPGGFPGGGMPGAGAGGMPGMPSMPGMPNMADIMSDPEVMEAMQNPKVMTAMQELMSGPGGPMGLMSNPGKLQELMSDPEVGPALQKLMSKFAGGAVPPGAGGAANNNDDEDIPDLDDLPDLE
ncbi:hypothetical protein ACA910_017952 [Epithemia clementina (nom. ined.)]